MKRIVLFVEGEGEAVAGPCLVKRVVTELNGWDAVHVDENPFRVGDIPKLAKDNYSNWKRKLQASLKRKDVGGVLVLLDGDAKKVAGSDFCVKNSACDLARHAAELGAGHLFSVASVFACREFESWFISGIRGFGDLPDGRTLAIPEKLPENPEIAPRDAKGWLRKVVSSGYKPSRDQAVLANALDLGVLRNSGARSFRRLENAIKQLIDACRSESHIVSPDFDAD